MAWQDDESGEPPRRTRRAVMIVGITVVSLVAAAVLAVYVLRNNKYAKQITARRTPDAGSIAPAGDASPRAVTIEIRGVPPNTQVRRGAEIIGVAPGMVTIAPFDASAITLVLVADGYEPSTLVVTEARRAYAATLREIPR